MPRLLPALPPVAGAAALPVAAAGVDDATIEGEAATDWGERPIGEADTDCTGAALEATGGDEAACVDTGA